MDDDLDAELRFHIDRETEELERRGIPPVDARRQARLAFGGFELMKEEARDARGTALVEELLQDVRYAYRTLRKAPIFTGTIVLLLALGIGANTATFAVVDALLLRRLPVPHPEQLVIVGDPAAVGSGWHGSPEIHYASFPLYLDLRDRTHVLSGLYASGSAGLLNVTTSLGSAEVDHPNWRLVTGNFFSVLGVPAWLGRTFTGTEDTVPLGDPVAVISYGYWQRRFGGDRSAIGAQITANGAPLTIVGVTPPAFTGDVVGRSTDIWIPMMMQRAILPDLALLGDRTWSWLQMMGRLAPGVSFEQARTELASLEVSIIRAHVSGTVLTEFDDDLKKEPAPIEPGAQGFSSLREAYGPALVLLMAAVGLVILIVCANIVNLMLVRSSARMREMTIRMAIGAGRGRLVRQLLTEGMVLAVAGGSLGLLAAETGSRLLVALASPDPATPLALDVHTDGRVITFTAVVTLLAAILFAVLPALRGTRVDLISALRADARMRFGWGRRGGFLTSRTLVVAQVALSAILLTGAGLLVRSMDRILTADLGMDRAHLLDVIVREKKAGYEGARAFALMRDLADRVARVPGVRAVSSSEHGLFTGGDGGMHISIPGRPSMTSEERQVHFDAVGPAFFRTIGARLLRGRDIDAHDDEGAAKVGVVNATFAKAYFPGLDPVGRTIATDDGPLTIVGEVADVQTNDVRAKPQRRLYLPLLQQEAPRVFCLVVQTAAAPSERIAEIRDAIRAADPRLDVELDPVDALIHQRVGDEVLLMEVMSGFSILALLLAALGIYGMTAYATSRRTGEFGLRVAIGANPSSIARMILAESASLAAVGMVCGIPAGLAATRLLQNQIFGVGRIDPPSLSAAVAILITTTLLAAYLPARRAARVSPLEALRTE
jgi:predicted permease